MSERDVENLFLECGFYDALDYEGTGTDLRGEFRPPDARRPDYITLDSNEAVTAVYEFKTTGRTLADHEPQLFGYMEHLRAEYGVLTNGEQLRLYRQDRDAPIARGHLESTTESEARDLVSAPVRLISPPPPVWNGYMGRSAPLLTVFTGSSTGTFKLWDTIVAGTRTPPARRVSLDDQ